MKNKKNKSFIPPFLKKRLYSVYLFFFNKQKYDNLKRYREHKASYGKNNSHLCFYVFRRDPRATGLLSCYLSFFGQLIEKESYFSSGKFTPVVDMFTEYFSLIHDGPNDLKNKNGWNYYFEPFSSFTMQEVLSSKNVILGYGYENKESQVFFHDAVFNKEVVHQFIKIHNKYFHIKKELEVRFEAYYISLFGNKRVLGTNIRESYIVLAAGRDNKESSYNGETISGHPIQPDIDELCDILEYKMRIWECDYLFAEFQTTFVEKKLRERFGSHFLYSDHRRFDVNSLSLNEFKDASIKQKLEYGMVQNNIDYLKSIYLLSKCTSIYAGKCSGTVVAAFWNNEKYERLEIFNKGTY